MIDGGPNGCTCGFNGDCNCTFVPSTGDAAPKKKRKKSISPTARTLAECKKRGIVAQVVERRLPRTFTTVDLFGVIDVVAIVPRIETVHGQALAGQIVGIQATTGSNHASRRDKILAEPRAKLWVDAGARLELWSWSCKGAAGKRKRWTLRVETFDEMCAAQTEVTR